MANLIKLTNINGFSGPSSHKLQWGPGHKWDVTHDGTTLCTDQVIHAYQNKYIAVIMNAVHSNFSPFRMWEAIGGIVAYNNGLKCGVKSLQTLRELGSKEIPTFTHKDLLNISVIANALFLCNHYDCTKSKKFINECDPKFLRWSLKYLQNKTTKCPSRFKPGTNLSRYRAVYCVNNTFSSSDLPSSILVDTANSLDAFLYAPLYNLEADQIVLQYVETNIQLMEFVKRTIKNTIKANNG